MKAIYLLIIAAPIYLFLVFGDFYWQPKNLIIPACVLLVCLWQTACPMLIKRSFAPRILNPLGAVCAAGSFIFGWYLILGTGTEIVPMAILLIVWTTIILAGFIRLFTHYEKKAVSITAAGGISLVLTGVLVKLLLLITGEDLFVFFAVSLIPLVLVLFFYSMTILMKRPEPA
jgi:hypothetical protein